MKKSLLFLVLLFLGLMPMVSASSPTIIINFAGNLGDSGGPYWRPPGYLPMHTIPLAGVWSDGYYTNDSWQQEDWIYINTTVTDTDGVSNVWLQWYNQTSNAWTNYTYAFANTVGNYWEYNTSGNVPVCGGNNYSFNIVANDTLGNTLDYYWRKSGLLLPDTRRYVQLNSTPVNISYSPYYFYDVTYGGLNCNDILRHDQGTDLGWCDSGYLLSTIPDDIVDERHCGSYVGFYFDNEVCPESFTLTNIYHHVWLSTDDDAVSNVGWHKSRDELTGVTLDSFSFPETDSKSRIYYDQGITGSDNNYDLVAKKQTITPTSFTDNDIYEFSWKMRDSSGYPSVISNRSFTSFIIFNIPSNTTLQGLDNDSDGLNDYEELFITFTNPWLADTDNDGFSDYQEQQLGSDPNKVNHAPDMPVPLPLDDAISVSRTIGQLRVLITHPDGDTCNASFYWGDGTLIGTMSNVENNTNTSVPIPYLLAGEQYFWYVNVTDIVGLWTRGPTSGNWTFTVASSSHPGDGDGDISDGDGDADITPPTTTPGVTVDDTGLWMVAIMFLIVGCIISYFAYSGKFKEV